MRTSIDELISKLEKIRERRGNCDVFITYPSGYQLNIEDVQETAGCAEVVIRNNSGDNAGTLFTK